MASPSNQQIASLHVVAMPYPGRGHITPMLNLCTAVAEKSAEILITFVITEEWLGLLGSVVKPPNIRFATIPNVVPSERVRGNDLNGFVTAAMTKMEEPFERLLDELQLPPPALIMTDAFLAWAADVAGRRDIPLAFLWTMSASVYTVFYHFDLLVQNGHFPIDMSVHGNDIVDYIPGLPPIHVSDLPKVIRDQEMTLSLIKILPPESKTNYLIFTSIYETESSVINALMHKSSFSIYNIGPSTSYHKPKHLINSSSTTISRENDTECYMKWLDIQPPNSVLYVSLGSFLSVSEAQMHEIAVGLHESGLRFLWVVRDETTKYKEICGDKGLVVAWCDQLRVLSHSCVGGFMTHCGWNSTKEALLAGVPMLTFPIIMDQLPNAKAIVEDWRVGWRVKREFDEGDLAKRDEIKEIVLRFMDLESDERKELSRNARELQMICEKEFGNGESFEKNVDGFIKSILKHSSSGT
ncbi:hypothetical protein ACJIZ3_012292 [Penstemon smallii]|uniref:Glycosyltransferase n=1 Tax=Penstemon smallii TaxID=265156 RepID=A0ABD3UMX0_9LAMI